ncbi:C2 domain-containing protein 5 [Bagarius yarrelli]|uniref:C2 domain-containing protein 5 n=1 Tax=Bagarius yarrelli TaxID=175774 RepID=A0A556VKX2_BAGYA|nr:C2 domain-containing protein 5 [Bagarius yarrelli]
MPGKLKAKIMAGRHLPVMDRASDLTDAFVEVKFGNTTFKTDVCPKSLNPQWNSEWFKFEVDDEDLQDEPLQITVLDHDTYSANDAIGKVYIDIDPLLCSEAATVISGWFPIYDTIHGIRGEIKVLVKVDLFNDLNRFRQSSCGVKFFCTTSIPRCYRAVMVHGFVEELVVNEDPEYQWIDRIRTPRASNEARQRLISLMSGCELQRKIGLKVLEMGGNAVVGYLQCFDLEGESGLVVRAIGPPTPLRAQTFSSFSPSKSYSRQSSSSDTELSLTPKTARICRSPILQSKSSPLPTTKALRSTTPPPLHVSQSDTAILRKSVSFSEDLLLAASGMGSGGSGGKEAGPLKALLRQQTQSALEQREFPFFTLTSFPPGFLLHVGGVVSARSVKLLDRIHNPDEPETRDAWWEEIRQEIKSHAKALGCHAVVGSRFIQDGALDTDHRLSRQHCTERVEGEMGSSASLGFDDVVPPVCGFCHIPYDELNMPFPAQLTFCHCCRRQKVPDVLFTTIDVPSEAHISGKGCLIQARLCRTKKKAQGEGNATAISNLLPFLEYELHTQLMNKLKLRSMNALFGLRIQISVGENMLLGLAEFMEELIGSPIPEPRQRSRLFRSHSESSDEVSELDLSHGKKDAFVLEMFTSVRVFRLSNINLTNQSLNKIFNDLCENLLKSLYFKLRSMMPCCLCHVNFTVAVPEDELIQVAVTAVAMSFDKDQTLENGRVGGEKTLTKVTESEDQLQFPLELPAESSSSSSNPFNSAKGLYGNEGLLPAKWMMRIVGKSVWERLRDTPTLLWFGPQLGLDTQHCMELLSLSGTVLSLSAMTVPVLRDCRLYLMLWVMYLSLYQVTPLPPLPSPPAAPLLSPLP